MRKRDYADNSSASSSGNFKKGDKTDSSLKKARETEAMMRSTTGYNARPR
jgi:hypothetical protein